MYNFDRIIEHFSRMNNLEGAGTDYPFMLFVYLGLFLFVAIPLPGTGGWTGALLAILLGLNRKKSFIAITLGIITAGIIMSILSYGILGNIIN